MKIKVATLIDGVLNYENEIENDLKTFQEIAGGYIESPTISRKLSSMGISIYINEDGKFKNLPLSLVIVDKNGNLLDTIQGNIVFFSSNSNGEEVSLTDSQVKFLKEFLSNMCIVTDNKTQKQHKVIAIEF